MAVIFSEILNMSLTGSVVILSVMAARLLLKSAPKIFSYALWSVVLFRLLCPVAFTAPVSILEVFQPEVTQASETTSTVYYLPDIVEPSVGYVAPSPDTDYPVTQESFGTDTEQALTPTQIASAVWLAGFISLVLYSVVQYVNLRIRLIGAVQIRDNVYLADQIGTAFVIGFFRPRIYLPSNVPSSERKFILAHERHHIRRFDHWIKLLAYLALCIHWFNPLAWAAFILAGKDMEMSCDEAVIKRMGSQIRADYSASLLRLATHKKIIAGMPLAFGEGDTKGRVMNMAKWKKPRLWVSVVCLMLCAAVLVACAVNPQGEKESLEEMTRTIGLASVGIGNLFFTLPQGYTIEMRESEVQPEGDLIQYENVIRKNETIVGGVYELAYPDFERNAAKNNTWDWVEALNVPENVPEERYMLSVSTGRDTPYSLSASYGKNGTEETVHYFFEGESHVYDLWFNMETVSEAEKNAFLDTARMEPPEEGESISIEVEPNQAAHSPTPSMGNHVQTNIKLITYGSLKMALTEQFESREEEGDVIITKDGIDVGGIRHWNYPDFQPSDIVELKKEESGVPIGYMSGSSAYGDMKYEVFWDGNPDGLNEQHTFFTDGDIIYDVWYDQNLISAGIAERFLKTVAINAEPVVVTEPGEQEAFAKCRAVLDAVQKGSYKIVTRQVTGSDENAMGHERIYSRSGEGWLSITNVLPMGADFTGEVEYAGTKSVLCINGKHFNYTGTEWVEIAEVENSRLPWLAEFTWDENIVAYMDTLTDEDGECVMLRVDEKYIDSDEYDPHYFLYFNFDSDGNFVNAQLQVNLFRENELAITESIVSLDPEAVNAEIQKEYQNAFAFRAINEMGAGAVFNPK